MPKIVLKANNDLISFCTCAEAMATTGQLDCPWCGCGWLFTCTQCRKAFTFGVVAESDLTPRQIGQRLQSSDPASVDEEDAEGAWEWLEYELEPLSVGQTVIYLDGAIRPVDTENLTFNGWCARHEFTRLPHKTVKDRADLDAFFGDKNYWLDRELPEDFDHEDQQ